MQRLKLPTKVGAIAVGVGGVTATLTADTAREWLELLAQYGPLILSAWLIYLVYLLDKERSELKEQIYILRIKVTRLERESTYNVPYRPSTDTEA